jgi:hypothetical protein
MPPDHRLPPLICVLKTLTESDAQVQDETPAEHLLRELASVLCLCDSSGQSDRGKPAGRRGTLTPVIGGIAAGIVTRE